MLVTKENYMPSWNINIKMWQANILRGKYDEISAEGNKEKHTVETLADKDQDVLHRQVEKLKIENQYFKRLNYEITNNNELLYQLNTVLTLNTCNQLLNEQVQTQANSVTLHCNKNF